MGKNQLILAVTLTVVYQQCPQIMYQNLLNFQAILVGNTLRGAIKSLINITIIKMMKKRKKEKIPRKSLHKKNSCQRKVHHYHNK